MVQDYDYFWIEPCQDLKSYCNQTSRPKSCLAPEANYCAYFKEGCLTTNYSRTTVLGECTACSDPKVIYYVPGKCPEDQNEGSTRVPVEELMGLDNELSENEETFIGFENDIPVGYFDEANVAEYCTDTAIGYCYSFSFYSRAYGSRTHSTCAR